MRIPVWIVGLLIVGASLYYLADRLFANLGSFSVLALGWTTLLIMLVAGIGYAVALILLASAWGMLLSAGLGQRLPWLQVVRVYGRSQVLKYIPSNVLHIAGRQLIGGRMGWPQLPIAAASLLEVLLQVTAVILLVSLLGRHGLEGLMPDVSRPWLVLAGLALIAGGWLVLYLAPMIPALGERFRAVNLRGLARDRHIPVALFLLLTFYFACGILLWALTSAIQGTWSWHGIPAMCQVFAAAWLVGFVSPGVSAGLGVREATLLVLLGPSLGEPTAMSAALAMRLVTTLGDLLFFGAVLRIGRLASSAELSQTATSRPDRGD
jgi:hypothetical protein